MRLISFHDWIRRIYATQDVELACDQVFELLPEYVDSEVTGDLHSRYTREIEQHLAQCPYCYDLYLGLRDAVMLEEEQPTLQRVPIEHCPPH